MSGNNWDDLRYLLAVARHGSLSAAARMLGVNHSTVLRRVTALEEALGVRLFDKLPGGYVLTAAGDEMQRVAARMEEEIVTANRLLSGRDMRIGGTLRVTTVDLLAVHYLPPHVAAFRARHPELRIDLTIAEASLSLTRREADVAIRLTNRPPENLIGRTLSGLAFAVYGARSYLEGRGGGRDPAGHDLAGHDCAGHDWADHDWVGLDETFDHTSMARWLQRSVPAERIGHRVNSVVAVMEAVRAGTGLGLLPCGFVDRQPEFRRLGPPVEEVGSAIWLLTHEDLRHMARVRAFLDHMAAAFARDRDLLEGRGGG
ncbi:LysR family transcriptional regulator [Azospirillum thermophilum]|uniref:LysR family transcriptional regulator n=1 Tax=Azospirillum thermophilum TaxID=2202148 RepID=A0A2S2CY03_9PROT|nr:LysR family transcriptional regulator [Azospirillum thermophilum]AWK89393.1 LysR family transcriptional regulator [Azospirillum thermophilum]